MYVKEAEHFRYTILTRSVFLLGIVYLVILSFTIGFMLYRSATLGLFLRPRERLYPAGRGCSRTSTVLSSLSPTDPCVNLALLHSSLSYRGLSHRGSPSLLEPRRPSCAVNFLSNAALLIEHVSAVYMCAHHVHRLGLEYERSD